MEKLNDDAILSILSYLDLTDQQTMLSVHWRFYNLMPTVWCLKYKTINISFFEIQFTEEHLHYFLRSIMKTVEVMRLKMLTPENFEVLTTYEYPKVQDFRFAQTSCQFLCDSHIARIITAFPNIRTFSPHGSFSGAHLTEFSHLKSLTLSYCTKFKVENLVKIMQKHQLRELKLGIFDGKSVEMATLPIESMSGLELIKLDLDELSWFDKHFSDLVSLKQLIVGAARQNSTLWNLCSKLKSSGRHSLKILETCNSSNTLNAVIHHNLHVNSLKIVTDNSLLQNIHDISINGFVNVTQIYFKSCCIETCLTFQNFMDKITTVEFLSIEQCTFLFDNYEFNANRITENRKTTLRINLFENISSLTEKPWLWSVEGENSRLIVLTGKNYDYSYEPIFIVFK